ncbi:endonuclease/exonuclease/phosphatase family protein [Lacticaseibacillus mingshuiensis]|uniref:Endonuclease/exonuclease/phosphatase family protein n=1 Tax=Lacticaseibacillus mingshuiensis TaxID=2799574 RepID=A0ABW4CGP5_9LACO|nr:endonuclease/exonuclease/phosphatase family protein [Lacticaseibacillus mingshuiensis]
MRIATYNLRVDTDYDKEWQWPYRAQYVLDLIKFHNWDVLAVEEIRPTQVKDLTEGLPEYHLLSQERDGDGTGEGIGLLFKENNYNLIDNGAFWLSQTPAQPSIYPGAAYPRVCVWAILQDRATCVETLVISVHLDNISEEARTNGMKVILKQLASQIAAYPTVILGDYNAEPEEAVHTLLTEAAFVNVKTLPDIQHYGPTGTFQNFTYTMPWRDLENIDYIYVKGLKTLKTGVLTDSFDGRYASDHFPLCAELAAE